MSSKDFQIISRLGEGSYSSVWKAKRTSDGQEYAMKKVKMSSLNDKEKENALNEVRILASIKNPSIIGYKEAFFEDNSMTLCIVMEYAAGGDIYNKIVAHQKAKTFFKEEEIWRYAIQMIMGLKALHDMKILHRDLKCANVFLSKDGKNVKLGDLNVSKVAKNNLVYTQTGTPYYASPEVWRDQPYDMKSDIWSLGCVIYEMAAQKPPFRANDMQGLFKKVQRGVFDRIPSQYSVDLYNLISMCLQVSPTMRPTCAQLLKNTLILKHGKDLLGDITEVENVRESKELLGTIKLPKNIKALQGQLPKPAYDATQSLEVERGKLAKALEERNISSGNGKRATSQMQPIIAGGVKGLPQPQSRESRVAYMQKLSMGDAETEAEYLARLQRDFIDNAKPIKAAEIMNKKPSNDDLIRQPAPSQLKNQNSNNALPPKKSSDNLVKKIESVNHNKQVIDQKKNYEALVQKNQVINDALKNLNSPAMNVRPSNSRGNPITDSLDLLYPLNNLEQNRPSNSSQGSRDANRPVYANKQEYIINKYQQDVNKVSNVPSPLYGNDKNSQQQKIYQDNNSILSRRAEYLLQKYQPGANLADKILDNKKQPEQILNNYNNIYNLKQQYDQVQYGKIPNNSPYQKIDNLYQQDAYKYGVQKKVGNENTNNNNNNYYQNNANHLRNNQQQQRGVTKPVWWG